MPERSYPSRHDIAVRIGQATQWKSRTLGVDYGCVPMSVAFTHGYSTAEQEHGLTLSPSIENITEGARYVAKQSGQELVHHQLTTKNPDILHEELASYLPQSESTWVAYFNSKKGQMLIGHMIGVIPTAPGEYSRWRSEIPKHIRKLDIDQLTQEIITDQHSESDDIYIYYFMSSEK